jgi:hypothetical protein
MSCPAHQLPEAEGSQGGIRSNHRLPLHGIHLDLIFFSESERDSFISRKRVRSRIRGCVRGCAREPRVSQPTRGADAPALQVDRTTHEGIGPTHVQNSAEDYQKTQRTIKLTRRSSHEPGSATRQRDPALAAVPQRYPRPSRSSKKNSFSHPPISQRGRT